MVWYPCALFHRWFRSSNIKPAIKLGGVASHNFSAQLLREPDSQRGFSGSSGPNNHNHRQVLRSSIQRRSHFKRLPMSENPWKSMCGAKKTSLTYERIRVTTAPTQSAPAKITRHLLT